MEANLIKDGKYYNTKKATLLMVSEHFMSRGCKRYAWYKSESGVYFKTYQHTNTPFRLASYRDLTINVNVTLEEIIGECTFEEIRSLFETAEKGGKIILNSGTYSFCVLRNESHPSGKLAIANKPSEFSKIVEV